MRSKRAGKQGGSAMIEFAFIVPIYFLIIFGLVELGIVFAGYCGAAYATQVAVRYAIVHGASSPYACNSSTLSALVAPYLWAAQKNSSAITSTWTPDNGTGSVVTVSITLTYNIGIPYSSLSTVKVGTSSQGTILY